MDVGFRTCGETTSFFLRHIRQARTSQSPKSRIRELSCSHDPSIDGTCAGSWILDSGWAVLNQNSANMILDQGFLDFGSRHDEIEAAFAKNRLTSDFRVRRWLPHRPDCGGRPKSEPGLLTVTTGARSPPPTPLKSRVQASHIRMTKVTPPTPPQIRWAARHDPD